MTLYAVNGARIYIGGVKDEQSTDFVAADFSSATWVEIKKWTQMGKIGDTSALISQNIIAEKRDKKAKGTRNAGSMQNIFAVSPADAGQIALIAAETDVNNYAFKILFDDAPVVKSAVVTATIATPGVITWTGHGLSVGDAISFSTTGALPTGITAGTTYYVKTVIDANSFSIAATSGGSAIATTGTQSGVHTGTTVPSGTLKYFVGLVMTVNEAGGSANTARNIDATIEINSNIVTVAAIN
jgi:hypothetical protein